MYFLIEVPELAARIAQKELALDPDGEAENVGKEQSAVERDALEIVVQDETAPRHQEVQLVHRPEAEREKDERGDEDGISEHGTPNLRGSHGQPQCVPRSSA